LGAATGNAEAERPGQSGHEQLATYELKAEMTVTNALCIEVSTDNSSSDCGCIGGRPGLPVGDRWPLCEICGDELVLFFDIQLPESAQSPFIPYSRLQVYACREHDDISGTIYSDYERSNQVALVKQLPPEFWKISDGHYLLRLLSPIEDTELGKQEDRLEKKFLKARESAEGCTHGLKLFGEPDWLQDPEVHICACGAPMALILQVPDGYGFQMMPNATEQSNSFSNSQYCLFLGNQLYLLGCTSQCNAHALWPVLQN
jgi:hypothetical protein